MASRIRESALDAGVPCMNFNVELLVRDKSSEMSWHGYIEHHSES